MAIHVKNYSFVIENNSLFLTVPNSVRTTPKSTRKPLYIERELFKTDSFSNGQKSFQEKFMTEKLCSREVFVFQPTWMHINVDLFLKKKNVSSKIL